MRRFCSLFLLSGCLVGCASKTVVEPVNIESSGAYRLRNQKMEVIVSPERSLVVSIRQIDSDIHPPSSMLLSDQDQFRLDDPFASLGYRVISAGDGRLIVESREQNASRVVVRREYRLEEESFVITTRIKPTRPAR